MKSLIPFTICLFFLFSCKDKESDIIKTPKGPTKIIGKVTIVNSDMPVEDIDVFLWNYSYDIFPKRELVDEAISDSAGAFELNFDITKPVFLGVNYNHTPYLSYRHVQEPTFNLDGKTHQHHIEMIPPAWVNVRMVDKSNFSGYKEIGVGSEHYRGGGWNIYGPKDSTIMVKVYGNMQDTISFGYWDVDGNWSPPYKLLKSLKFPVFVPPFQVQDLTIEY